MVPEKIHIHPMEGQWKWGSVLIAKHFEAKYQAKLEFLGGRESPKQEKTFPGVGYKHYRDFYLEIKCSK